MSATNILALQRKSREKLANAAARYVNLRAGGGSYEAPPIYCTDRAGQPVTVLLRLDIVSEETTDARA